MLLQRIILALHVLTCLMIVGLVLLQRGKGAEAGTGFGAGASGTVFGARGSASFLSRTTAVLATTFFITSLALAFFANEQSAPESVLERTLPRQSQSAPAPTQRDLDSPPALPDNTPARGTDDVPEVPDVADEPSAEAPAVDAPDAETPEGGSAPPAANEGDE